MKNDIFLNNLNVKELKNKENESSFVFDNLPEQLAITLGNYYRRVTLSYMKGISIFALRISGKDQELKSEFSVLKGMLETPPYLILNLKKVLISSKDKFVETEEDEKFKLEINIDNDVDSEYVVKAGDINDLSSKIKILNPELYIATISPFSSLKIEIYCRNSWGYKRNDEKLLTDSDDKGIILIDSNYNPITNVSYTTDFIVTGLEEQDEKLVLKIETNGSLSPKDALVRVLELSLKINKRILDNLNSDEDNSPSTEV